LDEFQNTHAQRGKISPQQRFLLDGRLVWKTKCQIARTDAAPRPGESQQQPADDSPEWLGKTQRQLRDQPRQQQQRRQQRVEQCGTDRFQSP
jgi:hypothetical protein